MTTGKTWDEKLDAPRFRKAFTLIAQGSNTWPTPKQFLETLPPREQLQLAKTTIPADPHRAEAALAEIAKLLRMPT